MSNWDDLSIRERANLIRMYMDGGILDLPSMRKHYNSFAKGGDKSYSVPTNEQIIGDLFSRINNMENVLAGEENVEENTDFIGPVLNAPVVSQIKENFEIAPVKVQPQVSTLYTRRPMNLYSQQQISDMFEDMETREKYDDKTYQVVDDINPSDINDAVSRLQRQDSKKEAQKYYSLKGEDAKKMQKELADEGYYSSILDGMSKEQIKATQLKLVQKGLLSNEKDANGNYKEVDGIAGKKTRAAFNNYQVDGIVGKNTRYAIELREQQKNSSATIFPDDSKVVAQKDKCAAFVRERFDEATGNKARDLGVSGNAWTMLKSVEKAGGTMVYNVFDSDSFKNVTTGNVRSLTSSEMKKHPFDTSTLQPGDIIGIYNPGTSHYAEVLRDGSTYNSHVGICTGYKDGKPIIEHAINGRIIKQTADTVKIAAVARPANSKFTEMNIGDSEEQKYYVRGQEENPLLNEYSKGLNNSAKYMSKVFPEVNFDNIQQIAISVLKRETGYMTNTESMQRKKSTVSNLKYGAKDFYKYNIKGESQEQKSSDLGKFKLSSLTPGEREMLGIDSPEDLNNPTMLSKAVTYYLAKNYTYFQNLSKKYPELGLTEEDIVNLTTISYNQGMGNLKSIGFKNGKIAPEEIRAIRDSANNDSVVDDIKSTTWSRGGKAGEFIGKATGWYTKSTSYSSSARRERENNIYTLSDTTK